MDIRIKKQINRKRYKDFTVGKEVLGVSYHKGYGGEEDMYMYATPTGIFWWRPDEIEVIKK